MTEAPLGYRRFIDTRLRFLAPLPSCGTGIAGCQNIEEQLRRSYQTQSILNDILKISLEDLPLNEQLQKAISKIVSVPFMELAPQGGVFLADKDQEKLILVADQNMPPGLLLKCANVPFGRCLCGTAADKKKVIFKKNIDEDHKIKYKGMTPHGHYSVPILARHLDDRILGIIVLYVEEGHVPESGEMEFLQTISDALAALIERKQAEETIEHMAFHDPLTGLPNRRLFVDRLNQALPYAKRNNFNMGVLVLNIDRFKLVNEALGHKTGDELLRTVSKRLKERLRQTDTIARSGVDEFDMVLTGPIRVETLGEIAQNTLRDIARPFRVGANEISITASLGASLYPADTEDPSALIENASAAMRRAKEQGGNDFQFYQTSMNAEVNRRWEMENMLSKAVDNREFVLYFQPIVNIKNNAIIGAEALIRWRQPKLGLIEPNDFIHLAEETGQIIPIGTWVLRTACAQGYAWSKMGFDKLQISVNVSGRQIQKGGLAETIAGVLEETGFDPGRLVLELTESVIIENLKTATATLKELKDIGVDIAIDDFGTGYSSLSSLKLFPFDVIKIDRSFINEIDVDPNSEAIVRATISIADSLSLQVIAEGVETQKQADILRAYRCPALQGFLFSVPLPAADFESKIKDSRNRELRSHKRAA